MPSHRSQHNTEDIKRGIIHIISTLKDPRLKEGFLSIVSVDVSRDNGSCHIFVSSLEGLEHSTEACKILNGACGFIRKRLGEKLRLRYIPNLVFFPTDTIEYAAKISKKIEELNKQGSLNESNQNVDTQNTHRAD